MAEQMKYRGYSGSAEISFEDDCLHGRIEHIDDIITYEGETLAQLRTAFALAVDRYIAHCEQTGQKPNKPYSGSFNVRIDPEQHRALAHHATKAKKSLNTAVKEAVAAYLDNEVGATASAVELLDPVFSVVERATGAEVHEIGHFVVGSARPIRHILHSLPAPEHEGQSHHGYTTH